MVKVSVDGVTLAESSETIVVEGNHYFNPSSLNRDLFTSSDTSTICGWKGTASYYDVKLPNGSVISDAAWYYPNTKEAAKNIEGYVAFYKNKVTIEN